VFALKVIIGKFHITCLQSWSATYMSIGQTYIYLLDYFAWCQLVLR